MVARHGASPDTDKIRAVGEFPQPKNIAVLLHRLLQDNCAFSWSPDGSVAFDALRRALRNPAVLWHFHPMADTTIHTDASGHELCAVSLQTTSVSSAEQVVAYMPAEQ